MPLMGSLYIGNSGLQTSQNALNTTAHNMTNADTVGYVRQQVHSLPCRKQQRLGPANILRHIVPTSTLREMGICRFGLRLPEPIIGPILAR